MVDQVTPIAGVNSEVIVGGTANVCIGPLPNGGVIVNPSSPDDQGLADTEDLFVDPVGEATLNGNGTTFRLAPGQSWEVVAGQTTPTYINAPSSGHKVSVFSY